MKPIAAAVLILTLSIPTWAADYNIGISKDLFLRQVLNPGSVCAPHERRPNVCSFRPTPRTLIGVRTDAAGHVAIALLQRSWNPNPRSEDNVNTIYHTLQFIGACLQVEDEGATYLDLLERGVVTKGNLRIIVRHHQPNVDTLVCGHKDDPLLSGK
jgi:hypothetical protein